LSGLDLAKVNESNWLYIYIYILVFYSYYYAYALSIFHAPESGMLSFLLLSFVQACKAGPPLWMVVPHKAPQLHKERKQYGKASCSWVSPAQLQCHPPLSESSLQCLIKFIYFIWRAKGSLTLWFCVKENSCFFLFSFLSSETVFT
jgi:hypothetical protein